MSTIGQLTNTLLNVSRAGLALITGYGVVKMIKGRADEDTKEFTEGLAMILVGAGLFSVTIVAKGYIT